MQLITPDQEHALIVCGYEQQLIVGKSYEWAEAVLQAWTRSRNKWASRRKVFQKRRRELKRAKEGHSAP